MTNEEIMFHAKDNLLVANMFQRQAETILDDRLARTEKLTDKEIKEIEHLLGCSNAHRMSAVDFLSGKF